MLLKIAHVDDAHDPRYVVLREPASYDLGFDSRNHVVLADSTVSPCHARLTLQGGKIFVEDLSGAGTFVDEQRIGGRTEVALTQWIRIGETVLQVLRGDSPPVINHDETRLDTAAERDFLDSLRANPADDGARLVYADWLEAESCPVTAGYIRRELADDVDINTSPLIERATVITTPEWRALVCRGRIGNCAVFECPGRWHALPATRDPFSRECQVCAQPVFYCPDREAVAGRGEHGDRVVFDASMAREAAAEVYHHGLYPEPGLGRTRGLADLFPALPSEDDALTHDRELDLDE